MSIDCSVFNSGFLSDWDKYLISAMYHNFFTSIAKSFHHNDNVY